MIVFTIAGLLSDVFAINTTIIGVTNNIPVLKQMILLRVNENKAHKVKAVASFYPIYDFVRQIGGDRVQVSIIISLGVEPHDWEPTIQQRLKAESSDMIVYNGAGFEK